MSAKHIMCYMTVFELKESKSIKKLKAICDMSSAGRSIWMR